MGRVELKSMYSLELIESSAREVFISRTLVEEAGERRVKGEKRTLLKTRNSHG